MADNGKKIEVEISKTKQNLTPLSGLFAIKELWRKAGISKVIDEHIAARQNKGYKDSDQILAMVMLNLAGGDSPEQFKTLREHLSLPGAAFKIPSVTAVRDYAAEFHDAENDSLRQKGVGLIPLATSCLQGFEAVHKHLFSLAYQHDPIKELTLDQDATFIETSTQGALYNYKGKRSFEALNLYCYDYDMILETEYRDGNVNPGKCQLEQLKKALSELPQDIKKVKFRSDSAGYQVDLLRFCAEGKDTAFGVIDFAISCPVCEEFLNAVRSVPEADWQPLADGQEWAEVIYAPNSLCTSKRGPAYRFLAIREVLGENEEISQQLLIPEIIEQMESENKKLKKLHLTDMCGNVYKVFGVVTNLLETSGRDVILWHRGRCGKSEEVHRILKEDLAGGHIISRKLGANALWWNVAVLAMSLHSLVKQMLLPKAVKKCRPKTLRFLFYMMVGRVIHHARRIVLRVDDGIGARWLLEAWQRLKSLSFVPA